MSSANPELSPTQRRGMRYAILAQCFGTLPTLTLSSGLALVYFTALGINPVRIVTYLAIPSLGTAVLQVFLAILADRIGRKTVGTFGALLVFAGFCLLTLAASLAWHEPVVLLGLILVAAGMAGLGSSWFALLSHLVPAEVRGRFFGRLRLTWQLCGILFMAISAVALMDATNLRIYQIVIGLVALAQLQRIFLYRKIPDLGPTEPDTLRPMKAIAGLLTRSGYVSFCAYTFLLAVFTTAAPTLFATVEKQVLQLSDARVVLLGNVAMVGAILGFYFGGRSVDRQGTRKVFLVCHFGYGATILLFLMRGAVAPGSPALMGLLTLVHALFGMITAASSIAITSELLELIPEERRSLSTSLCVSLGMAGAALSNLLSAGALNMGLLSDHWTMLGHTMSAYDAVLLAYAVMIVMLVITLGLVPSVRGGSAWIPRAG